MVVISIRDTKMRCGLAALGLVWGLLAGRVDAATLSVDRPQGQPVGTTLSLTVGGEGAPSELFRLIVRPVGEPIASLRDFGPNAVFQWTPIDEGPYVLIGSVMNLDTGVVTSAGMLYDVAPRAPRARFRPVVSPSSHPLVAIYSAPPCHPSATMHVAFALQAGGAITQMSTAPKRCRSGRTMNFYVAGMRPDSTYLMHHVLTGPSGNTLATGRDLPFDTGSLPFATPPTTVVDPADGETSNAEKLILQSSLIGNAGLGIPAFPYAIDLDGEVVWYAEAPAGFEAPRPGSGGTLFLILDDEATGMSNQTLREIDLVGNVVRETSAQRLNQQLVARGEDPVSGIHHEARPLPNRHTAVLGYVERILTDVQGPGPVNVLADNVMVLDQNFQLVWTWNAFDHLDPSRAAILGEICSPGAGGCPGQLNTPTANDWLHSNAITYSPADGNLLISVRHQDWIIKIDYQDGAGNGDVIWRLGPGGDFALASAEPFPWFSHPHDPNFGASDVLAVYDNGNTRCSLDPNSCFSRGQVYQLDEQSRTATLLVDAELPEYAFALGSAQPLLNGNFHFNSGLLAGFAQAASGAREVRPDGTLILSVEQGMFTYRSHRLLDLYTPPPFWLVPPN